MNDRKFSPFIIKKIPLVPRGNNNNIEYVIPGKKLETTTKISRSFSSRFFENSPCSYDRFFEQMTM